MLINKYETTEIWLYDTIVRQINEINCGMAMHMYVIRVNCHIHVICVCVIQIYRIGYDRIAMT